MRPRNICTVFFVLITSPLFAANLVQNPSMEGSFIEADVGYVAEYWSAFYSTPCPYIAFYFSQGNYAHDGIKSHLMSWYSRGDFETLLYDFGPDGIYQQMSPVDPGLIYKASVWFKLRFQTWASGFTYATVTCRLGTDPNGGTNPGVVVNWMGDSDSTYASEYEGPWIQSSIFFSPATTVATLFVEVTGYGEARAYCDPWNPYCEQVPSPWMAYCYIDDVSITRIEIGHGSTVEAASPVPANGFHHSEIVITVVDSNGLPFEGIPASEIDVSCTGSGNIIIAPDKPTDVNGRTTAKIKSTIAEIKTVSVTVLGTVLSDTATAEFGEPYLGPDWFVDALNGGYANGSAEYPFRTITDAIIPAQNGDTITVRPGTYQENVDNSSKALTIRSTDPSDWSIVRATVIDANNQGSVVVFDNPNPEAADYAGIRGFTITGGNAGNGGGIRCSGFLTIENNIITKNVVSSWYGGGGIDCSGYPIINNTIITQNSATYYGGAIRSGGGFPIVRNSVISDNSANYGGGVGGYIGLLENCVITNNSTWGGGGGVYDCDGTIVNCTIAYNDANYQGGGLSNCNGPIKNCIIWHNTADYTGAQLYSISSEPTYSCIQDWAGGGIGNISDDPLFADPDSNDFHVLSEAGRWDPVLGDWVADATTSPCIDAGEPLSRIGVEPNPNGARINMGAYGGTSEAGKSPSGIVQPVCSEYPAMDFNKDCKVDFADFADICENWLECNLDPAQMCAE